MVAKTTARSDTNYGCLFRNCCRNCTNSITNPDLAFIENSAIEGATATVRVALFATAVLSTIVTRRFLTESSVELAPTVPRHIRIGLLRLYLVLVIPLVGWFGHTAYVTNRSLSFHYSQSRLVTLWLYENGDLDKIRPPTSKGAVRGLAIARAVWDARTNEEIIERIQESTSERMQRLIAAIYALLAGAILPLLYPICVWIIAGFRRPRLMAAGD
jgi:hypothetical protein